MRRHSLSISFGRSLNFRTASPCVTCLIRMSKSASAPPDVFLCPVVCLREPTTADWDPSACHPLDQVGNMSDDRFNLMFSCKFVVAVTIVAVFYRDVQFLQHQTYSTSDRTSTRPCLICLLFLIIYRTHVADKLPWTVCQQFAHFRLASSRCLSLSPGNESPALFYWLN